jgi:selenoprotein W-related protein
VAEILDLGKQEVAEATLIPSSGGVFEVQVDDRLIFSKRESGRFPEEGELAQRVAPLLGLS